MSSATRENGPGPALGRAASLAVRIALAGALSLAAGGQGRARASTLLPEARAEGGAPASLVASGCSISTLGYLTGLAAAYERASGTRMYIRGGGTVVGIDDLAAGKVDFAAACRGPERTDPAGVEFVQVAWDALVFIANPENPARGITLAEARAVLEGRIADWSRIPGGTGGPITVFLQRPTAGLSGVEHCVRTLVLGGGAPAKGPRFVELASSALVEQLVAKTPAGFGVSGFSSARHRAVTMLALDRVEPTRETIARRSYPLLRPLYLVVRTPVTPAVRAFVDFALGPAGQECIGAQGAVSLRDVR